jgi:hypothetical protein
MATYVNNLRLTELATGEGSGTWGTTTNTNLELIGQALGFGTRAIANASTDNITIADGVSDADRAMYLKLTGGGQACTVTILPNTASKVWWMENATSYTLTFTCGSGANVAVLAGETKCISTDGLGSGGAVYDVLTDVNLAGTTKVDDLVVGDALTVGGTLGVTGVLTTTAATVFNGGFASNADSTLGTDKKVQFRDAAIYINSSVDGQLDIVADTEIQIAATTIDINGAINASGEIIAASLDISGDIDVDGTTNLDVVDIDGAVDMASTLAVAGAATFSSTIAATVATLGTSSVGTDNTAPSALILRHESDQTSGFDDNFGVGMKFNADASNGGYATHAELSATQKSTGYQLRFKVGGTERLNLDSTGGFVTTPAAAGHAVFNEDGIDADFRVESDTNTHMLFVDGGANHVNIGTATDLGGTLNVLGNTAISGTTGGAYVATGATLSIQGTGTFNSNYFGSSLATVAIRSNEPANNSWNPTLHITTIRQSLGTNENSTGGIGFTTVDDSNNTGIDDAARIQVINLAPSSATSATGLVFYNNVGGSKTQAAQAVFKLVPIEAAFNDDSADIDFRVESNNQSEMLIVNAGTDLVGIKGNPAGANGVLQVTGSIGLTGNAEIRQSTNADGSTLRFLGTQLVIANSNGNGYSYSGGGLVASVAPASGAIMLDVGAVDTSGHRLKVINGGDGIQGSLQYLSSTTARLNIDSATGAFTTTPTTAGHAVFNEDGVDADFRVESDSNTHMLFVDAGNSHVGMGTATLNRSGLGADHIVLTVGADTEMGMLELQGTRTSDADLGRISFLNAGTRRAEIVAARIDADNSTKLYFQTSDAGSLGTRLTIGKDGAATFNSSVSTGGDIILPSTGKLYSSGDTDSFLQFNQPNTLRAIIGDSTRMIIEPNTTVFNEDSADVDFRVESDNDANAFFVQGSNGFVGIGTGSPVSITGAAGPILDMQGPNPEIVFHDNDGTANAMSMYYLNDTLRWWGDGAQNMSLDNSGNLTVAGALSKGSGSFKIDHPLPAKTETHNLVHSFIEGPQADNIYRGKVTLVDGSATVNIDTVSGMSEGTYVLLNTNTQCFTSNESGWTAVKGSVAGNILTIEAQESCSDTISWMVVGERHDQHMLDTEWTDENGKVIVEPLKELES